ncbi:MAG: hypothetical protein CM15mP112_04250 [Flavobacteriales bacterium]|nr:MAG: hypothetical protein CM15mP112_04250 [Flavobacteriales bacterium]
MLKNYSGTNMFAYYAGSFNKIQNANKRLNEAKNLGLRTHLFLLLRMEFE